MAPCAPAKCAVLVPYNHSIDMLCDASLRVLEARGYSVIRTWGYSAIDYGRSMMASKALAEGFEEILWIDSDIRFEPDSVERLRAHERDVVCAIYPKKGVHEFAFVKKDNTKEVVFGREGGLVEIRHAGAGFLLTRRSVYRKIYESSHLPTCDEQFGKPFVPYFMPLILETEQGPHYLLEDYAFCERARQAGLEIWADTTIRLFHVGAYAYSWEDAGSPKMPRYATYRCGIGSSSSASTLPPETVQPPKPKRPARGKPKRG